MKQIVVMQFGESCFRDDSTFQTILDIIKQASETPIVIVVSALPGIRRLLEECANKANTCSSYAQNLNEIKSAHINIMNSLLDEPNKSQADDFLNERFFYLEQILEDVEEYGLSANKLDMIYSFGEIFSGHLLNQYLTSKGIESEYLLGDKFLITDSKYNNALPIMNITVRKVRALLFPLIKLGHKPVITGFIGRNKEGHLTTLGPSASEFTAALVAYCLKDANFNTKVIIWKEVDGIKNADPYLISSARTIKELSYAEAKEIAIGTYIIHPKCIQPIQSREITLEVRNFANPTSPNFTIVLKNPSIKSEIVGITYHEEVAMISAVSESTVEIPGVLAKIFTVMGENNINITMISQSSSEIDTTFAVNAEDGDDAKQLLSESDFFREWFEIRVAYVGMISIIGTGITNPKNLEILFNTLHKNQIKVLALSMASDGLNITLLIEKANLTKGVQAIHKAFGLDKD